MLGDGHQRLRQHLIVGMDRDFADELAVDLDHVEAEIPQIPERRIACAKIVKRKADPVSLHFPHERLDLVRQAHGRAFGDFQDQPLGHRRILRDAVAHRDLVLAGPQHRRGLVDGRVVPTRSCTSTTRAGPIR